jgi:hypothetical protein
MSYPSLVLDDLVKAQTVTDTKEAEGVVLGELHKV